MTPAVHPTLAQAAEPIVEGRWTIDPQVSPYLLAAGMLAAGVAVFYLYRAQRRVASGVAIAALTVIRVLLVALVFAMLLGVGWVFSRTGRSDGTLWLVLDASQSMDRPDPHASPVEKLRWADALGLLPAGVRPAAADRQAARLAALQGDLLYFQALTGQPVEERDAKAKVEEMARGLKRWNSLLTDVAEAVDKDAADKGGSVGGDPDVSRSLRSAADTAARGIEKVEARSRPEETAGDLPWAELAVTLRRAGEALTGRADKADQALLDRDDPRVVGAVEKVGKMTRAELARDVVGRQGKRGPAGSGNGGFEELFPKQKLKVVAFGDAPQVTIPEQNQAGQAVRSALAKPAAPVTDLSAGLQAVYDQVGQGEPAAVVVVSDGRQTRGDADAAEVVRRLAGRGVRVYALALGTDRVAPDAAVEAIDAPDWVFKGDTVKLTALVRLDNLAGKTVQVELHRVRTVDGAPQDTLVDTKEVRVQRDRDVVSFTEKKDALPEPGLYDYRVVIKDVPDEVVTANNAQVARVWVKEDKLAVLMIEDQPRWEFRYAANYLARDNRVRLQTMLLQPARIGYDPDPRKNIAPPPPRKPTTDDADARQDFQVLPETQEEWYRWEVIVLGDVPPERIPRPQQEMIVKAVRDRGATLVVLAGPLAMPAAWGTGRGEYPLAELFPCDPSPDWTPGVLGAHLKVGYHPAVAPDGERHPLTQFGIEDEQNRRVWDTIGRDPNLAWYWHSEYTQAKGGASVIWSIADDLPGSSRAAAAANPADANAGPTALELARRRALLATMNAGLGKVMYLAGDATWRLRQVHGVNYHERFWGQVVRWSVDAALPGGGRLVRFGSDKPRYVGGEQAVVTTQVRNKDLVPQPGLKVKVQARALATAVEPGSTSKTLVDAEMTEVPGAPGRYQAVLASMPAGQVELSLKGPEVERLLADDPKATQRTLAVEVVKTLNLEMKNVNADWRSLASLSAAGGGAALNGAYADVLAGHVPELNYTTTTAEQIGLFTDPRERYARVSHWAFLVAFVTLATAEWVIRKMAGLV